MDKSERHFRFHHMTEPVSAKTDEWEAGQRSEQPGGAPKKYAFVDFVFPNSCPFEREQHQPGSGIYTHNRIAALPLWFDWTARAA